MVTWVAVGVVALAGVLPGWDFSNPEDAADWQPNAHLADVRFEDGALAARAVDWDPFLTCTGLDMPTTPWQYVELEIRASAAGQGDLFWSGETTGPHGGFSESRKTSLSLAGTGDWETVRIVPGWHTAPVIRQLRLDLYAGAAFALRRIRIGSWQRDREPVTDETTWDLSAQPGWDFAPGAGLRLGPPMALDVAGKAWAAVEMAADQAGAAALVWATAGQPGLHTAHFTLLGDGAMHTYNVELQGLPAWQSPVVLLGLRLPEGTAPRVARVALAAAPSGPPDVRVEFFGAGSAPRRVGAPATALLRLRNHGGEPSAPGEAVLEVTEPLALESSAGQPIPALRHGAHADLVWTLRAPRPGSHAMGARFTGLDVAAASASLDFTPSLGAAPAAYVPEPRPVDSSATILAYYFPGWEGPGKWTPIQETAPWRRPVLGYYDESLTEAVDWQIKWAVENGISGFLLDWYWIAGSQHLTHWLEAYRGARYRDHLDLALMWANHNPPGTHSPEDWERVTRHWIEHVFNLPRYYRIDGKPALFLWDPGLLRSDLGGSDAVRAALDASQAMAQAAGYSGIAFVAMRGAESASEAARLAAEGYHGVTNYHEWGAAPERGAGPKLLDFEDVVETAPDAWRAKQANAGELVYYPVADTGWDSRPWHGTDALVIAGRTVAGWTRLLESARDYLGETGQDTLILGPLNEWGEGSYIEPNAEYGFAMYEAVRHVFAITPAAEWPGNLAPSDIGLGPYDYPPLPEVAAWSFDEGLGGWSAMMGVDAFRIEDGALRFRTTTRDPAIVAALRPLEGGDWPVLTITMRVTADAPVGMGQLFWASDGAAATEATSIRFDIRPGGGFETYRLDLGAHPRWRGRVTSLRLDPGSRADAEVAIYAIRFEPASATR